jgi:O-antigen/teichoic acid export membrane protein
LIRRSLLQNAASNLAGGLIPALVTILTIPFIVNRLGSAGFGVLTLITSIVGYFALIDINVTAGSTKFISEYHARNDQQKLRDAINFGLLIYVIIGVVGATAVFLAGPSLVERFFSIPAELRTEAIASVQVAAIGFLFGQLQVYLHSLPGALLRFDVSGRLESIFGVAVSLASVAVLAAGYGLFAIVLVRVLLSVLNCVVLWLALTRLLPGFVIAWPGLEIRKKILAFSAYSFLSRFANLSLLHLDKLIISAAVGVQMLTYYAIPATLINRVMALVGRLPRVVFPHASALSAHGDWLELERVYVGASRYVFFVNGAVALLLAMFSEGLLRYWISAEFAANGALVLTILAMAAWIESLSNLPSLVNDGLGHPRVTGLFAVSHAVVALGLIVLLVEPFGIVGAALGHLIVSALMGLAFMFYVHGRTVPVKLRTLMLRAYAPAVVIIALASVPAWFLHAYAIESVMALLTCGALVSMLLGVMGFSFILEPEHRQRLGAWVRRR